MRNRKAIVIGELVVLAFAACGGAGDQGPAPVDAAAGPPQLAGVYTCSFEAIDARSDCGGPVLTTDLSGQALTMTMSQTGTTLEAGMWGKILTGSVQTDGRVALLYRDITCTVCSGDRPFIIDFTGTAGTRQISNISVRMYQIVLGECEKTYQGTCATNR